MFGLVSKKKIRAILQFERDLKEFHSRPTTQQAEDYWKREWFNKCSKINDLVKDKKEKQ